MKPTNYSPETFEYQIAPTDRDEIAPLDSDRPSQEFMEFYQRLLNDVASQVGIPDEYWKAMRYCDMLQEFYDAERLMEIIAAHNRRRRAIRSMQRAWFIIGILLGIGLIILLTHL